MERNFFFLIHYLDEITLCEMCFQVLELSLNDWKPGWSLKGQVEMLPFMEETEIVDWFLFCFLEALIGLGSKKCIPNGFNIFRFGRDL